ncbi:hypothetical protein VNO78_17345 [Psophocarpus tetragonolobus]|uniref:Uncharacterized protein n=1 Tax=Psophocarpus tetragonolobus TaxID=3891 RepID=A0AAN9SHQ8_PSOTE
MNYRLDINEDEANKQLVYDGFKFDDGKKNMPPLMKLRIQNSNELKRRLQSTDLWESCDNAIPEHIKKGKQNQNSAGADSHNTGTECMSLGQQRAHTDQKD